MLELPYGRQPYLLDEELFGGRTVRVLAAPSLPAPPATDALIAAALATPLAGPRLATLVRPGARVTVIISDATRAEPRSAFLRAIRSELAGIGVRWTIAVATGTHGPCAVDALGVPPELLADAELVMHDGHDPRAMVELGTTAAGTPVRVHRCVIDADLVIATGCIRPHYFAGFGAGVKAIFPGLGDATAIRINHRLKTAPGARAGVVAGNPCREDLDDAAERVPTPTFLVNGVCGPDGEIRAVVAGEVPVAFAAGVALARPWFTVRARPAALVIASDRPPVTDTLYQAAKIAAAMAPLVAQDGTLAVVAECGDGVGPLEVVNEAILRIGVLPRLASGARLVLLSGLPLGLVARTLVQHAAALEDVILGTSGDVLVVPRASQLICEVAS